MEVGRGSYGRVCPAWDEEEERLVAIKMQQRSSATARRDMMLFQCVPKHPHVLRLLDVFVSKSGSELCLVFEYCIHSLADVYWRAQGFLDWSAAWRCSHQILQGIAHLHANDVAHRDLSIANVLMTGDGDCVVADLGLAVSVTSIMLEKPVTAAWYRAPEACFPGTEVSTQETALDMWSFGVLLAALWTGTHLFQFHATQTAGPETENCMLLQRIVNVMGCPEDGWPDVAKFPQWPKVREALQGPKEQEPLLDLLRSARVKRSLLGWPETENLIVSLLVWDPKMRAPAERCLQHELWGQRIQLKVQRPLDAASPQSSHDSQATPECKAPSPMREPETGGNAHSPAGQKG